MLCVMYIVFEVWFLLRVEKILVGVLVLLIGLCFERLNRVFGLS